MSQLATYHQLRELTGRDVSTFHRWRRVGLITRAGIDDRGRALFDVDQVVDVARRMTNGAATNRARLVGQSQAGARQPRVDTQPVSTSTPTPTPPPAPDTLVSAYEQATQLCRDYLEAGATPEYVASVLDLSVDQVRVIARSRRQRRDNL